MDKSELLTQALARRPRIGLDVFVAPNAVLIGDVTLGDQASVWFHSVLRGDLQPVVIGPGTNIQDGSICHVGHDVPCLIGSFNTVGHRAILHGCTVGDENLIGMGAILMDGVRIGNQCIIGAGALLTKGLSVPDGSLVYGSPARIVSKLDAHERGEIRRWAETYVALARTYLKLGPRPRAD